MKLGRNDPCHCGSGRKYKTCHQISDEGRERAERSLKTLGEWVDFHRGDLAGRLNDAPLQGEGVAEALAIAAPGGVPAAPLADPALAGIALYDLPPRATGPGLRAALTAEDADDKRSLVEALAGTVVSLHEVTECKRGKGVRLVDRITGQNRFVSDALLADQLEPLEVVLGRIIVLNQTAILLGGWEKVAFRGRKKAIDDVRAQALAAGVPDDVAARAAWLKAHGASVVARARATAPAA